MRIYTGLSVNKIYVGAAQAQLWIYRYRADLLDAIGDAEMTDEVCTTLLPPNRGNFDEATYVWRSTRDFPGTFPTRSPRPQAMCVCVCPAALTPAAPPPNRPCGWPAWSSPPTGCAGSNR